MATRTVVIKAVVTSPGTDPVEVGDAEDAVAEEAEAIREMGTRGRGPLRTRHPTVQGGGTTTRRTDRKETPLRQLVVYARSRNT